MRDAIAAHGIRNALLTSIAPTGTISLFADNVSSGVEPVFASPTPARCCSRTGKREEEVSDYACGASARSTARRPAARLFRRRPDLTPADHVRMQAAVQRHVDSSISKTINVPEDIPFEEFKDVYLEAYRSGCKGCTTYRPNAVTGSVLEARPADGDRLPVAPDEQAICWCASDKLSGAHLQDALAGQRPRHLHHHQRHRAGRRRRGRSRCSSTPRTWSIMPGRWR